jgi:hypothetical protein
MGKLVDGKMVSSSCLVFIYFLIVLIDRMMYILSGNVNIFSQKEKNNLYLLIYGYFLYLQ